MKGNLQEKIRRLFTWNMKFGFRWILIIFICRTQKRNLTKIEYAYFDPLSLVARTAFSNPLHLIIGSITGIVFWVVTNTFDSILFFSPFLAFYVPSDMHGIFFLSCINSTLVGILVNFNLHIIRNLKLRISKSALSGTTISIIFEYKC